MVALWGCFLNVFVFIIVFLLVRSLREWVCHLQRWQLLIVASNESKFDFQPALMRMNIHWRVRGSLVRNGWWIPHYPIWTTSPPNQLLFSFFAKRNKQSNSQANDYHPPHNLFWTTWPVATQPKKSFSNFHSSSATFLFLLFLHLFSILKEEMSFPDLGIGPHFLQLVLVADLPILAWRSPTVLSLFSPLQYYLCPFL